MNNLRWTLAAALIVGSFLLCALAGYPLIAPPSY